MPKIAVEIEWDQPDEKHWLCPDNIRTALGEYCASTAFSVVELVAEDAPLSLPEKTPRDPQEERAEQIRNCQDPGLAYLQKAMDAERRMAEGQDQVFCQTCCRHKWPDELCAIALVE